MHSVAGNREPGRLCTLASAEWCCPSAEVNPVAEGKCNYRPDAGDGSTGFDSGGEYTGIVPNKSIHYRLEADREMEFTASGNGAKVVETFGAENENSAEQQRQAGLVFPIILTRALKVYTTDMVRKPARERAQQGFRARSRENTEWI